MAQSRDTKLEEETTRLWQKCEVLVEEASSHANHYREQGAVLLRWSVTTCLTLNVGALVATLNAVDFDLRSRFWAGIWFLGGSLLALIVSAPLASAFLKMANKWAYIAKEIKIALRQRDLKLLNGLEGEDIKKGEARGGLAFFLSFLAIVAFLIGSVIMIEG